MKLEAYSFCTSSGVTVDDNPIEDMDLEELRLVATKLIPLCNVAMLKYFIEDTVKSAGTQTMDSHCETCGDYNTIDELEIK